MLHIKKRYLIPSIIVILLFIVLFFLSSIAKNYINKNSEELAGRKININELNINYLKVKVIIGNFIMYEENKVDTFISFDQLIVDFSPWNLINKEFSFSQIQLKSPHINIEQEGDIFNFSSLIPPTDSNQIEEVQTPEDTTQANIKYSIEDFKLITGRFKYYDKQIDNLLELGNLNFSLPEFAWDSQSSKMGLEFSIGDNGVVKINSTISEYLAEYKVDFQTKNIQLNAFTNYLNEYVNISDLKGLLQTDIHIEGSLKETSNITINGKIGIDSLSIKDGMNNNLITVASINTTLKDIDLGNSRFLLDNIDINEPVISATLGKESTNFEYFLAPLLLEEDSSLQAIDTTNTSTETEGIEPYFDLAKFNINNGTIIFRDSTLNRSFKYDIKEINVDASDINLTNNSIPLNFSMKFLNNGAFVGKALIDPQEPHNLTLESRLSSLGLLSFSPYTEYHLGYPITSGLFNYTCDVKMTPTKLINGNDVFVKDIEFGKSTKDTTATKVPLKLAMAILKDANDNVEMNVPVTGNPSEPGFRLGKLIWKTFGKFMAKAAASPFGALGKMIGTTAEELEYIPFEYTQDSLAIAQKDILDKIADILTKKPDLIFTFRQDLSMDDEIHILAEKEIKQRYIDENSNIKDSAWYHVENDNNKFIAFLNKVSPETAELEMSLRFSKLGDLEKEKAEFERLYKLRNETIINYLTNTKACKLESTRILTVDFENMPEELKNPGFKVDVSVR